MHLTKLVVFGAAAVLTATSAAIGLALAPASAAGAWAGKKIVDRLSAHVFVRAVPAAAGIGEDPWEEDARPR